MKAGSLIPGDSRAATKGVATRASFSLSASESPVFRSVSLALPNCCECIAYIRLKLDWPFDELRAATEEAVPEVAVTTVALVVATALPADIPETGAIGDDISIIVALSKEVTRLTDGVPGRVVALLDIQLLS